MSHQQICQICCITRATLSKYLKQYQYGGRESLKELGYQGQRSKLNQHSLTIEQDFRNAPPRSIAEAVQRIEEITGIKRSPTQVGEFMKRIGMKTRKIGYIPGKAANEEKIKEQEQFRIEQLEPLLKEAKEEIITVTNETYINSVSVCELLDKLAALSLSIPLTLGLDNARYQKCQLVREHAKKLGIELLYLPSYSPHLNLIERFWKFVRNECLYSKYYENFDSFKKAISDCLETAHIGKKQKLAKLLTWNFQSFEYFT